MNKLLIRQTAEFFSSNPEIDPNLMNLFKTISDTYDFFENKLNALVVPESNGKRRFAERLQVQKKTNVPQLKKPLGYASLVPAWAFDPQTPKSQLP